MIFLSRDLPRPCDQSVMGRLTLSHSGRGDIMCLVCHLVSKDDVVKGSCNFIYGSPSRYFTTLPSLVAVGTVKVGIQ